MRGVLVALAEDLRFRGRFHLHEASIDGSFAPAKKRGAGVGKTKRSKGTKIMAVPDSWASYFRLCAIRSAPRGHTRAKETG